MTTPASARPDAPVEASIRPGSYVAEGRYRLLERHLASGGLQFWRGRDTVINRDVALIVVPVPAGWQAGRDRFFELLCMRTASAGFGHAGVVARVFDIVDARRFQLVVAEWTPGSSLVDVAVRRPAPAVIVAMMTDLVEMVRTTHHLSAIPCLDNPGRIRVNVDGKAVLAFPATLPEWDKADDVAGLGALLQDLLGDDEGRLGEYALRNVADDALSGRITTAAAFADRFTASLPQPRSGSHGTVSGTGQARTPSPVGADEATWLAAGDLPGSAPSPHRTDIRPRAVLAGAAVFLLFLGSFVGLGWTAGNALWGVNSGLMPTKSIPLLPSSDDRADAAAPQSAPIFRSSDLLLAVGAGVDVRQWVLDDMQLVAVDDLLDRSRQLTGRLVRLQSAIPMIAASPSLAHDVHDETHAMDPRTESDLDVLSPRVQQWNSPSEG
ncbi:MAG TPA: hypothetical protein VFN32_05130 [Rhodococcus sp. (in: high G+C Gram-positive bacteria)]|nr:hypothetical protein [Rhodococcus sp. (in: high G+C Gram-positive bacteria)]